MDDRRLLQCLKALSDPTRFRIVREVASAGELCCGELVARFRLAQPTISHHLKVLGDAGVLETRRAGQHSIFRVNARLLDHVGRAVPKSLRPKRRPPKEIRAR